MNAVTAHQPAAGHRHSDRVLALIALFKFVKSAVLIAAGLGTFRLLRADWADQARSAFETIGGSVDLVPVVRLMQQIGALSASRLRLLGIAALLYATLFLIEGVGLWWEQRWAEFLTVIATGSFIPFEIYELTRRLTWPRGGALLVNVVVVLYLIWRLQHPLATQRPRALP
jgi:uncharacterized membrane protein (DUF2068 family)